MFFFREPRPRAERSPAASAFEHSSASVQTFFFSVAVLGVLGGAFRGSLVVALVKLIIHAQIVFVHPAITPVSNLRFLQAQGTGCVADPPSLRW